MESVFFHFHIPLEPAELDEEANRIIATIEKSMPSEQLTKEFRQRALERVHLLVGEHRPGHFQVKCRILDGDRVIGVGAVELEVLFKGRVSDAYTSPPA